MVVRLHLEGKITHVVEGKNSCVNLNQQEARRVSMASALIV
jgi:hypothetical protein